MFRASNSTTTLIEGLWRLATDPTSLLITDSYYGEVVTIGGGGVSTKYSVYYWTSGSAWALADADSSATAQGLLGMAIGTTYSAGMVLRGYVYRSAWNWTPGQVLYLSTTDGDITSTQPSGTSDIVRVVGYAISADIIYFNPSQDWIELV